MLEFNNVFPVAVLLMFTTAMAVSTLGAEKGWWDFGTENPYRAFNSMVNDKFMDVLGIQAVKPWSVDTFGVDGGYYFQCYLRDLVMGTLVYWVTASLWHIAIYKIYVKELFHDKGRPLPSTEIIQFSMALAQSSLFVYAALPVISEYLIESKLTHTYFYVNEVGGWGMYFLYLLCYIVLVEIGVYWAHRSEHEVKFLYKYIHALHHKFEKPESLTPWASIAFNPIDGMIQASPYVICLFLVPCHYFTHVFLLFFSGIWATNIHDAMWADTEPIMGAKYHTLHHTHFLYNHGQFFIFCDWFWGTLRAPEKTKFD
eukprot:scaffold3776_cov166-Ochromonas_danica.AAC.8